MQIFEGRASFPMWPVFWGNDLLVPCTRTVMSDCIDTGSRGANVILRRPQQRDAGIHIEPILRRIRTQGVLHWCPFSVIFEELFRVCCQIISSLSQSLTTTFTSRRTTRRFETSADTVRHPLFAITETFCHHWVSSRFVRWMYSTRMFWWYISPAILRRHVSCQFLSLRWNNVFVNWRPQTSAFIFRCWYPPSSVGIHRPVLAFTVQCWRSPSNIGIHRPVLAFTVQCWHSPSSVGIHRPVLAFIVYWWHSPSSVGIHRPVLAFNVQCWHLPYSVGTHRLLMAFTVHCWHSPSSVGIHHSVGSCFADWEYVPNTSCRYVAVF